MAYTIPTYPLSNASMGVQHGIPAGSQFTGVLPATTPTVANGSSKYAGSAGAVGGLFDVQAGEPYVASLRADFGASAIAYTVYIVNLDGSNAEIAGETITIASGSAKFVYLVDVHLLAQQALKLVTTGGAAAMIASVQVITEKGYRG